MVDHSIFLRRGFENMDRPGQNLPDPGPRNRRQIITPRFFEDEDENENELSDRAQDSASDRRSRTLPHVPVLVSIHPADSDAPLSAS